MNVIEAEGLHKSFRIPSVRRETVREHFFAAFRPRSFERLTVLDGVSLTVRRGETLGIMGRNGSGKSTLLKILCGIYAPDAGRVTLNATITPILELGVGWNPELDAIDNILLIGTAMGMSLSEARAATAAILEFAGLERFARLELKHYSSGMAARLAYAVAFHAVREVLVLDEVFAVGDAGFRQRCERRYRELVAAGHTAILVSHYPEIVRSMCDRALLIDGGRVVCEGSTADVAAAYLERVGAAADPPA
ncbi:MAG: ABC transporter ATP-binding protein [Vicinamibacteria bacterium]|nr:ABC transporter ATP-binding protein [Vicinamibacteria bacterium]